VGGLEPPSREAVDFESTAISFLKVIYISQEPILRHLKLLNNSYLFFYILQDRTLFGQTGHFLDTF